jgi:density-regulated protein
MNFNKGIDLKKAAKQFASKFAAAASVSKIPSGGEEILVQGECGEELFSFILSTYSQIDASLISFGDPVRKKKPEPVNNVPPQFQE